MSVSPGLCPSAESFLGRGAATLVAFDFDGTLAEISAQPEDVYLRESVFSDLQRLSELSSRQVFVLICSGRSLSDLEKRVPQGIDLMGSHGIEWCVQGVRLCWADDSWWRWREQALGPLRSEIQARGGVLEDKQFGLTIHYRSSPEAWTSPEAYQQLVKIADNQVGVMPGIQSWNFLGKGWMPGMLSPRVMTKGDALAFYARSYAFQQVIYFGDEPTDETVFERRDFPLSGVRVLAASKSREAKDKIATAAIYGVQGVEGVRRWLSNLIEWMGR